MSKTRILIAIVTSVSQRDGGVNFMAESIKTKEPYACIYDGFLLVQKDDIIHLVAELDDRTFHLTKRPLVIPNDSRDTIVELISTILRKHKEKSELLYMKLLQIVGDVPERIPRFLDILSDKFVNDVTFELPIASSSVFPTIEVDGIEIEVPKMDLLTSGKTKMFLNNWYKKRVLRSCYLLGLTKTQILESEIPSYLLVDKLLLDPLSVYSVPIELALELLYARGKVPTSDELWRANAGRMVYNMMYKSKWNCVPLSYAESIKHQLLNMPFKIYQDRVYIESRLKAEQVFLKKLKDVILKPQGTEIIHVTSGLKLSQDQQDALKVILNSRFCILTGAAGTGKTTVLKDVVLSHISRNDTCMLSSFTGRATSRIAEIMLEKHYIIQLKSHLIGFGTIHKLITKRFRGNVGILIIDETSMLSLPLFAKLLECMDTIPRILLVGDPNQLEPIEWGQMFTQLILSRRIPHVTLTVNHRNSKSILENAERLLRNDPFVFDENFVWLPRGDPIDISMKYKVDDVKILSPYNKTANEHNSKLQALRFPESPSVLDFERNRWRLHDRVLMRQNDYDNDVMNGTEGIVNFIGPESINVDFNGTPITFSLRDIKPTDDNDKPKTTKMLTPSYSNTVHLIQGSEKPVIIIYLPFPSKNRDFINKKLFYTAITRAKDKVFIIGSKESIESARQEHNPIRYDFLADQIKELN